VPLDLYTKLYARRHCAGTIQPTGNIKSIKEAIQMASTGYVNPTNSYEGGVPYGNVTFNPTETDFIGGAKLGAEINIPNSVAGPALRQKLIVLSGSSGIVSTETQVPVAHGCVDSAGNPVAPVLYAFLAVNQAEVFFSQQADTVNLYITAVNASSSTPTTGTIVVLY
jgi:hypothetical protein